MRARGRSEFEVRTVKGPRPSYPFRPKSTTYLAVGQFWAVPLANGKFACGRVAQLVGSEIGATRVRFFGGLQDWFSDSPPTTETIRGAGMLRWGVMHLKAITTTGGEILGERPFELDAIELPLQLSAACGRWNYLLRGADAIRKARKADLGRFRVLGNWGYNFIRAVAQAELRRRGID